MKLLILQFSLFFCYFIPLRIKYSPQKPVLKYTPSMFLPYERDHVSHPYKTNGRIVSLYILTFTFLDSRRDDKRLWTEWQQAFPEFSLLLISS
jgi:hypothetical protein